MRANVKPLLLISLVTLFSCISAVVGMKNAPDFTLTDIYGNSFSLSSCPAKVILIDFFGTTCPPCEVEVLTLQSLYQEYLRDELEIISISPQDETTLRNFAQQQGMEWIVAKDTAGVVDAYLGLDTRIPHTFLVANGTIRYDLLGWGVERGDPSNLRSEIDSLLSGTGNGDSDGDSTDDSGTGQTGPPYTLIAIIGGAVIIFLIVGIVAAGQLLGWSESPKKRHFHKGKR